MNLDQARAVRLKAVEARVRSPSDGTAPTPAPRRAEPTAASVDQAPMVTRPAVDIARLNRARATRNAQVAARAIQQAEFATTRPTPTRAENDRAAADPADIVMVKTWDLSPVTETSFDPSEPPGRPAPIPVCTQPPEIITPPPVVGAGQAMTTGSWTNSPTGYAYVWKRNGAQIAGASAQVYTPVDADLGTYLSGAVAARNAGGQGAWRDSENTVGPVAPAARRKVDDSKTKVHADREAKAPRR
jgi:hypothetical protein